MKPYTNLIFIFLFSITAFTAVASPDVTPEMMCLKNELTNSAWQFSEKETWQFEEDGTFFLFNENNDQYRIGQWQVELGQLQLIFADHSQTYKLGGKCGSGLIALNYAASNAISLKATQRSATNARQLKGDWQIGFSQNGELLHFEENGNFHSTGLLNETYNIVSGRWALTPNGQSLLLYTMDGTLTVVEIKHLQMDELVITIGNTEASEDYYLNKL